MILHLLFQFYEQIFAFNCLLKVASLVWMRINALSRFVLIDMTKYPIFV